MPACGGQAQSRWANRLLALYPEPVIIAGKGHRSSEICAVSLKSTIQWSIYIMIEIGEEQVPFDWLHTFADFLKVLRYLAVVHPTLGSGTFETCREVQLYVDLLSG